MLPYPKQFSNSSNLWLDILLPLMQFHVALGNLNYGMLKPHYIVSLTEICSDIADCGCICRLNDAEHCKSKLTTTWMCLIAPAHVQKQAWLHSWNVISRRGTINTCHDQHWKWKVVQLTTLSSLKALKAVDRTAFNAFSVDKAVNRMSFHSELIQNKNQREELVTESTLTFSDSHEGQWRIKQSAVHTPCHPCCWSHDHQQVTWPLTGHMTISKSASEGCFHRWIMSYF